MKEEEKMSAASHTRSQSHVTRWRKKPVVIEAIQWFKLGDHPAVRPGYINAAGSIVDPTNDLANIADCRRTNIIKTLEGWHEVGVGDWIIRGVKGELYPCKPDIFAETYEPAQKATAGEPRGEATSDSPALKEKPHG